VDLFLYCDYFDELICGEDASWWLVVGSRDFVCSIHHFSPTPNLSSSFPAMMLGLLKTGKSALCFNFIDYLAKLPILLHLP
jgi:hypothetical protein